jgi:hypothetical protein
MPLCLHSVYVGLRNLSFFVCFKSEQSMFRKWQEQRGMLFALPKLRPNKDSVQTRCMVHIMVKHCALIARQNVDIILNGGTFNRKAKGVTSILTMNSPSPSKKRLECCSIKHILHRLCGHTYSYTTRYCNGSRCGPDTYTVYRITYGDLCSECDKRVQRHRDNITKANGGGSGP